jgi:hypothetical protein
VEYILELTTNPNCYFLNEQLVSAKPLAPLFADGR